MKRFRYQRKAHMTLLETLIAVSILSVLLVFVFGFFRELSEISRMTEESQKQSFHMRYLESRLGFIFERVVNENEYKTRPFFFYTQPTNRNFSSAPSLILTFYNEVRLDPTFSGDVLGRLYVDLDKRLCLATWPLHVSDSNQYLQEEVLMENVIDVSYSFYAAPERVKDGKEIDTGEKIDPEKKTPEKDKWHDEWLITYKQMPSIVKLVVKVAKDPNSSPNPSDKDKVKEFVLHFVLPSSKNYVYYPPGELSS
jgi:hypothetical protein